jgi:glycosyltransferase involved in cell wall biosynthesis
VINLARTYEDLKPNLFRKIFCLSEWHRDALISQYSGLTEDRMSLTFNGVNTELYEDVYTVPKRNMMVWSSCKERGLKYFIDAVYPCVKRMVPDFELVVCAYNNDVPASYATLPGITIVGRLSKKDLADLQKQAKVWMYLNYGDDEETGYRAHETFCISAVENGLAKNALICSNATGLATTLKGYSGLIGTDMDLSFDNVTLEKRHDLKNEIAEQAIKVLNDDDYREQLANEAYEICKKYTWENAAKSLLEVMEK